MTKGVPFEDFLEHYGIKGMKWGVIRTDAQISAASQKKVAKKNAKALDKQSKANDKKTHKETVESARARIDSGQNRQRYLDAKTQYKQDKLALGKREARKAFDAAKQKNIDDYNKSLEYSDGKDAAKRVLATVAGAVVVSSLVAATKQY